MARWGLLDAFRDQQDNMAANGSGGTNLTHPATAHTWSSWVSVISSTIQAQYMVIGAFGNTLGGTNSAAMIELGFGASPSFSFLPEFVVGYSGPARVWGFWVHVPSGQQLSARVRGARVSPVVTSLGVWLFGDKSLAAAPWVGSKITAYGTVLASSRGTLLTAGNGSKGSWVSLGTASDDHKMLVLSVGGGDDTTLASKNFFFDIGLGATPTLVLEDLFVWCENAEHISGPFGLGMVPLLLPVKNGDAIQTRSASVSTGNLVLDAAAYGVS